MSPNPLSLAVTADIVDADLKTKAQKIKYSNMAINWRHKLYQVLFLFMGGHKLAKVKDGWLSS